MRAAARGGCAASGACESRVCVLHRRDDASDQPLAAHRPFKPWQSRPPSLYPRPMRILFVTATRIGDAVLSTGVLSHLLDRYPGARITIAAGRDAAPLFDDLPGLERIITI